MLTLEIEDARLEKKIRTRAKAIGKSVQEFIKEIISEKIDEEKDLEGLPFEVPKLNVRDYIKTIDETFDEALIDDTPLFDNGIETIEFAKQLREKAWKRQS